MNILFIATENPFPPDHGHHIKTYNDLKGLAKNNTVYFVGFAKNQDELQFQQSLESLCEGVDIFRLASGSGWRLYLDLFLNLFSFLPFVVQRYYLSDARKRIKTLLRTVQIDLVHIDLLHVSRYQEDVGAIPKVLVNHNVESVRLLRRIKTERNLLAKLYFYLQYDKLKRYEKRICSKFNTCVAVSDVDKAYFASLTRDADFVTIPNGVDITFFKRNGVLPKPNTLVWVGSMSGAYNADAVDYFLDCILPLIASEIPRVKVTFVGSSPTRRLMQKSAHNKNLFVAGYVDDVRPYMEEAAVFIAPIRSGSGTKIKILNALAMEMPVVTTPVGAEGIEVVDEESILIATDEHDFADKTIRLLKNPEHARKLGKAGRQVVKKCYDWNKIHKKTAALHAQLVK